MWLWWLIFLLFAAALGYFTTWYFVSHRIPPHEAGPGNSPADNLQLFSLKFPNLGAGKTNLNLESRLQSIESKVNQYTNGQHDLMAKLAKLERAHPATGASGEITNAIISPEDEGWEEMYYEAREAREQLEEQAEKNLDQFEARERIISELTEKIKLAESRASSQPSLQLDEGNRKIAELEHKLESALAENNLLRNLPVKAGAADVALALRNENTRLKSELEDMHKFADSLLRKSFQIESKLDKLSKYKNEFNLKEDERKELTDSVEEIFSENEKLALKIKDMQDKLKNRRFSHTLSL